MAIKAGHCNPGEEQTLFTHNVSTGSSHGVVTQQWHAGTHGDPIVRVYVDDETSDPAIQYAIALAHGLAAKDNGTYPFQSALFGHTHNMGW